MECIFSYKTEYDKQTLCHDSSSSSHYLFYTFGMNPTTNRLKQLPGDTFVRLNELDVWFNLLVYRETLSKHYF